MDSRLGMDGPHPTIRSGVGRKSFKVHADAQGPASARMELAKGVK